SSSVVARFIGHCLINQTTTRSDSTRAVNKNLRQNHGFSLIELLVALVILSVVLLPFLSTISYRLSKERENDEMIKAIEIAKSKMEEVLLLPEIKDSEEIIENKFLIKIKILDGDKYDEPVNLKPIEARITVLRLKDKVKLIELSALK
ncbi:type II secretion system protein, partial [candidate division WOR-3 bacterium]|nr:type II secretion system protein [candidate division WOR-3 bacterium]